MKVKRTGIVTHRAAFLRSRETDGRFMFCKKRMNTNNEAITLIECCGGFFQLGRPKKWSH